MNKPSLIKKEVSSIYPQLGINKKREVVRLVFETASREKKNYKRILKELKKRKLYSFTKVKEYLLKRRFPLSCSANMEPYLPSLEIEPSLRVRINKKNFYPKRIFFDSAGEESKIFRRAAEKYPRSEKIKIKSLKDFIKEKGFSVKDYNRRRENLFIVREKYDFLKKCPCTSNSVNCGYNIINMGFGCPYECTYCYLQEYANTPGIVIHSNPQDFIEELKGKIRPGLRYGTGEFTDSLAVDEISGFSKDLIKLFSGSGSVLELKTKSVNINNILESSSSGDCVVSWSLNPENFVRKNEFYTAGLKERLEAAGECCRAGWDIAFHFDPIVLYPDWEKEYEKTVNMMFDYVPERRIRWISLGTFRFKRQLKKIIENRFPKSDILNGELSIDFDGKLRYPAALRLDAYLKMKKFIEKHSREILIYLCMEEKKMWESSGLKPVWKWNR